MNFPNQAFLKLERLGIHSICLQVYLPSCMFVVVSWVSFLIKPEVVPGRWGKINQKLIFTHNYQDGSSCHSIPGFD